MKVPTFADDEEPSGFEAKVAEKVARGKPERRERRIEDRTFGRLVEQVGGMMRGETPWEGAKPSHFVALYALLHERVYGVEVAELTPSARARAAGLATNLLRKHFDYDADQGAAKERMAAFMRWAWQREERIEKRRRATGGTGRLGWYRQFDGSLLTEYLVERARQR